MKYILSLWLVCFVLTSCISVDIKNGTNEEENIEVKKEINL